MNGYPKALNEPVLEDDYPVYHGHFYLADGRMIASDIEGTVKDLKKDLSAKEIRRYDISARLENGDIF